MNSLEILITVLTVLIVVIISYIGYRCYQTEKIRKTWTPQVEDLVHFHMENPVIGEIVEIGDTYSTIQLRIRNDRMYPAQIVNNF